MWFVCLEQGADLHMAQLMPLPLTVSCFSKIQIGFSFLVPVHPGSPGKGPLNGYDSAAVAADSSHMTASSSTLWSRLSPPSNVVNGHVSTVWFMVCRWPQSREGDWARPRSCAFLSSKTHPIFSFLFLKLQFMRIKMYIFCCCYKVQRYHGQL